MSFLYTTAQIRQLEQNAIENSITADMMMQKAGSAVLQTITKHWPHTSSIIVFCGSGNNGGDGYVVARLAHEKGINVEVRHLGELNKLKNEALCAMQACEKQGVTIKPFDTNESLTADIFVDALLGIGLKGQVKQNYAEAINYLNNSTVDIISVDIPSGINADTGAVLGNAVIANCTITFIGIKPGLLTGDAPDYCGDLICDNLDLPEKLFAQVEYPAEMIALDDYENNFIPRILTANKGDFGHVLVIGGDHGMSGAPHMAASAAARVGAGMLTIATRPEHATVLNIAQPELMCRGIKTAKELIALIKKASVIAIGPGLGQSAWSQSILKTTLKCAANKPLVVDADALNLLAKTPSSQPNWVLTPHPGEAARLLNTNTCDIQNDRFTAITAIQKKYGGICILKGAGSLTYDGENPIKICTAGNPGMASGGMGDVLTGVIAGLAAQEIPLATAAECGVCLHAEAADCAAHTLGERGLLATDLLPYLQTLVNL
ncbi:MAG: NAD(P)H-hydrate dehydratase [Gammaproteobacteria bacterium]|jgi:NAD(P)H-hydrate epimerase